MENAVHILAYGAPLCRFHPGPPSRWPNGNRWVAFTDEEVLQISNCQKCRQIHEMSDKEKEELMAKQDAEAHMKIDDEETSQERVRRLERRVKQLEGGMRTLSLDFELNDEAVKAIEYLLGERLPVATSGMGFFLSRVRAERVRQDQKWGHQSHQDANPVLLDRSGGGQLEEVAKKFHDLRAKELEICTADRAKFLCKTAFDRGEGSWSVILVEEIAEAVAAIGDDVDLLHELVQVAAVATAWGECVQERIERGIR